MLRWLLCVSAHPNFWPKNYKHTWVLTQDTYNVIPISFLSAEPRVAKQTNCKSNAHSKPITKCKTER